ncbi:hypothetical protein ACWEOZ_32880 [Actinoplanes sp. NPDC004185]
MLRVVGHWDDPSAPDGWPDVRDFIRDDLPADERDVVVDFLRSGTVFVASAGFSACRVCGIHNGSTELTDGEHFTWPEGLDHYVESHDVRLPDEVVEVARRGPARPVDPYAIERALFETRQLTIDEQWWRSLPAIMSRRDKPSADERQQRHPQARIAADPYS